MMRRSGSRTVWCDVDAQDRGYKSWKSVCVESDSEPFELEERQEPSGLHRAVTLGSGNVVYDFCAKC